MQALSRRSGLRAAEGVRANGFKIHRREDLK